MAPRLTPTIRIRRALAAVIAAATVLAASPATATTATIDGNGNILVDGTPFFPIGIYHVSWIGGRQGNAAQVADIDAIADAGFNLVHPTVDLRPGMAAVLDRAAARGLRVIAELPWAAAADVIALWQDRPAMIGWNIADDFNAPYSGPPNHPPAELTERRDFVTALAPQHLTYASGGSFPGFVIEPYAGTVDVMGFQSYPIDGQSTPTEYELQENVDGFDYVASQLAPSGQPFIPNPQSFKWNGGGAFPTPQEARNLLFPPLMRGAKGVIFYTYWGENGVLSQVNPSLWAELGREVAELKTLTPFLLGTAPVPFVTGHARVHGAYWMLQHQIVAMVLNTHRSDSYAVALDLPPGALGAAQALFPTRAEAGMSVAGSQLAGTIGPLEVHVYVIDVTLPGNLSPLPAATVAPAEIGAGDLITFDATGSSDGDGTPAEWHWDFGDGEVAGGAVVTHAYPTVGERAVRLTVRDDDGAPATLFVPVSVQLTSLCPPTPAAGCRAATASSLAITETGKRTLKWKWAGAATSLAELGDPTDDTRYALCVYDAGGRALATTALPSPSAWRQTGGGDFRYSDGAGQPGGIVRAKLHPGAAGRARIQMLAKGSALPSADLPLDLPVTVQAIRSGVGPCWSATYVSSQLNSATRFRAR